MIIVLKICNLKVQNAKLTDNLVVELKGNRRKEACVTFFSTNSHLEKNRNSKSNIKLGI